jgi:hypothetical protein
MARMLEEADREWELTGICLVRHLSFPAEPLVLTHGRAGLKKLLKPDEELPALYSDPLIQRASTWVLSTSSVFSKHFPVYGWGEVVPDGFGLPYMTGYDGQFSAFLFPVAMSLNDHARCRSAAVYTDIQEGDAQRAIHSRNCQSRGGLVCLAHTSGATKTQALTLEATPREN